MNTVRGHGECDDAAIATALTFATKTDAYTTSTG
jgi:hypothetical protein